MGILEAFILGVVQGITEFLPVSSSGHIEIVKVLLNTPVKEQNLLMTIVLHVATALSTIFVFWKDIKQILIGLFEFRLNEELKFSLKIIISMIPAVMIGLFFEAEIESLFKGQIILVGSFLILTGLLLFLANQAIQTGQKVTKTKALLIGIAQAIAILPGISRSGATIATSVLLGIDREKAARFSFLMVVPLILGKITKDLLDGEIQTEYNSSLPLVIGFIAAFLTGLIACKWMIALVKKSQLKYFSYYCFLAGSISLILSLI
ncbi:MAG: UDP-diphosphatase [Flavobacteriales bacterium]|nr:UDP-diphosphatase [Flavobacteriales bacterium]|tara:strand:+ start:10881 stop:11669 length:789 start_codon:yes stop_codon:yes gene_type:complete